MFLIIILSLSVPSIYDTHLIFLLSPLNISVTHPNVFPSITQGTQYLEAGHFGEGRVECIEEITEECAIASRNAVPVWGICIYPLIDRPDWDNLLSFSHCGIFYLGPMGNRIPHEDYIESIKKLDSENSQVFKASRI